MLTAAAFRSLALALPDVVEGAHHGHPDFRSNGRVIASLHPDGRQAMVVLSPAQQRALVQQHGTTFAPANGAWGRAGCTMVTLAAADRAVVHAALQDAWQVAMAQLRRAPKSRSKAGSGPVARTRAKKRR